MIGEMALAVYESHLEEIDIERRIRKFVNVEYRRDHDRFGPVSLDQALFDDGATTLVDRISVGLWQ